MLHWEYAEDIHKDAGLLFTPFTCAPLTYSQGNRVPSFQPDQQEAKHPETLDLCGKTTAAERTVIARRAHGARYGAAQGGVGTTWQELAAGQ